MAVDVAIICSADHEKLDDTPNPFDDVDWLGIICIYLFFLGLLQVGFMFLCELDDRVMTQGMVRICWALGSVPISRQVNCQLSKLLICSTFGVLSVASRL